MSSPGLPDNFTRTVPDGDTHERDVCGKCGFIHYQNPKVVVGSVVQHDGKILLCRRAIEPRSGFWTIPAGYLELGETAAEGAMREAEEEACAEIVIDAVLAVYTIARIGQVQVMHTARLASPKFKPGPESTEVALFAWDDIPWDDLAFPSVHWVLNHFREVEGKGTFPAFTNPPGETGNMR
ncbi:MAG: NUDIX hydrolase [Hyphomicrobiaceae bacterium]|nr:NUDIX hydrolase [Hyphomicrobiaceae bacterium]